MIIEAELKSRLTTSTPAAFRDWLTERLAAAVPASSDLDDGFRLPGREGLATPAAVLIPLIGAAAGLDVLFTLRSAHLADHGGQVSFPGGRAEADDPSLEYTALREAREEIGLHSDRVTLLGRLADYHTASGFRVAPVLGWLEPPFDLSPDPTEVAEVFTVPLAFLFDAANYQRHSRRIGDRERQYYVLQYGERTIWGATAAMLVMLHRTLSGATTPPRNDVA